MLLLLATFFHVGLLLRIHLHLVSAISSGSRARGGGLGGNSQFCAPAGGQRRFIHSSFERLANFDDVVWVGISVPPQSEYLCDGVLWYPTPQHQNLR